MTPATGMNSIIKQRRLFSVNLKSCFRLLQFALVMALAGCATIHHDYPRTESHTLTDTNQTTLGKGLSELSLQHPDGSSGFKLLVDGVDAFALRILLAERAEKSIDTQYYLITNDLIGFAFLNSLLEAADRGVRVRLLLDDIQTKGYDTGMAALDSHPNIEIRVFNPFANRGARFFDVLDFSRVNRRMHNKSFTVDNQITIIGGRNIANEYFGAREDVNFSDVDVAGIGPIVNDVSYMFDTYWNSWAAYPLPAFAKIPDDPSAALIEFRQRTGRILSEASSGLYVEAIDQDYASYMQSKTNDFEWVPYELVYDSPDKADKEKAKTAESITTRLEAAIAQTEKEFILISPYFVPLKSGEDYFQKLVDRGIKVIVITNSLASNNHAITHSGYAPSRKRLLQMGVRLFETKAIGLNKDYARVGNENTRSTLHTKAFIMDRRKIFVGSFNWDPRSININTESGVIIDSENMGRTITADMDEQLATRTYEVVLNKDGNLRWIDDSNLERKFLTKEPDTSWWKRFSTGLMGLLPVKQQL